MSVVVEVLSALVLAASLIVLVRIARPKVVLPDTHADTVAALEAMQRLRVTERAQEHRIWMHLAARVLAVEDEMANINAECRRAHGDIPDRYAMLACEIGSLLEEAQGHAARWES